MSIYNPSKYIVSLFLFGLVFTVLNLVIDMSDFFAPSGSAATFILWLWFPGVPAGFFVAATVNLIILAQYHRGPPGGGYFL